MPYASDVKNDHFTIDWRSRDTDTHRSVVYLFPFRRAAFFSSAKPDSENEFYEKIERVLESRGYTLRYRNPEIEDNFYHDLSLPKLLCNIFYREEFLAKKR